MTANQFELYAIRTPSVGASLGLSLGDSPRHRLRIKLTQQKIQPSQIGNRSRLSIHSRKNCAPNPSREGKPLVRDKCVARTLLSAERRAPRQSAGRCRTFEAPVDPHERHVNPVRRSAAHHAGNDHAPGSESFMASRSIPATRTSSPNSQSRRVSRSVFSGVSREAFRRDDAKSFRLSL